MAETQSSAAPAVDAEAINKAVQAAVAAALPDALKPITEQLTQLRSAQPTQQQQNAGRAADADKPLTLADVTKAINDAMGQRDNASKLSAARDRFISDKMKDLPGAYLRDMPNTDKPEELAAAEQRIRAQYQADLKTAGIKPQPVGGQTPQNGASPLSTVDRSKLNPVQLIGEGLKSSQPQIAAQSSATASKT